VGGEPLFDMPLGMTGKGDNEMGLGSIPQEFLKRGTGRILAQMEKLRASKEIDRYGCARKRMKGGSKSLLKSKWLGAEVSSLSGESILKIIHGPNGWDVMRVLFGDLGETREIGMMRTHL